MYSYPEIKSFGGLYLQQNSFNLPDGAMEVANNVSIPSDDLIQKCRGYYNYFSQDNTSQLNNLFLFEDYLLSITDSALSYYTDTGLDPNLVGQQHIIPQDDSATIEISYPDVSRSVQSNGNLYFTTDNGVLKLPDVTSRVYQSGAPQGLDIETSIVLNGVATSFIGPAVSVGYRVLFGYMDLNDNLILGAPSGVAAVTNPYVTNVTATTPGGASPVYTVVSPLHGLTTGMSIQVILNPAIPEPPSTLTVVAAGLFSITYFDPNTFTYVATGSTAPAGTGPINYAFAMPLRLEFSIPSQISTNLQWFYQVYRSSQNIGFIQSDYRLVIQSPLTSAQITNRIAFFVDSTPDNFLGAYLYTNENSREGELQANYRAPKCVDMTLFNNYTIYANCITRHTLQLNVIDTTNLVGEYLTLTISDVADSFGQTAVRTRRYFGRAGVTSSDSGGNETLQGACSDPGDGSLLITLAGINIGPPATSGMWSVFISNSVGGSLSETIYYASYVSSGSFKLCTTPQNWITNTFVPFSGEVSTYFEFVNSCRDTHTLQPFSRSGGKVTFSTNADFMSKDMTVLVTASTGGVDAISGGLYQITDFSIGSISFIDGGPDVAPGNTASYNVFEPLFFVDQNTSSSALRLSNTAQSLVKAINRDIYSLIYAQYISSFFEVPGHMIFQSKGFGPPIYAFASSQDAGKGYFPSISQPSTYPVSSTDQELPNGFYSSKLNEPEAVPIVNFFPIGSKDAQILRVHALKYCIIVIKEDGVWRVTGDSPANFSVTLVDGTVRCAAPSSSKVINNQVIMLSNQGVCLITDTSVTVISRKIENAIQPILTQPGIDINTSAVAYEVDRQYLITTTLPGDPLTEKVYSYNILTDGWSTTDFVFKQALVGPNNILYYIDFENNIKKERKNNSKIDFTGQNHDIICNSVEPDGKSSFITSTLYSPKYGDIIVVDSSVNIIVSVLEISGGLYYVSFFTNCNLEEAQNYILYESYKSTIQMAPYTGGLVGRSKQYAQMQVHFRENSAESLDITFSGDTFGGSEPTVWNSLLTNPGWGAFPWGFDEWGQENSVELPITTTPGPICRIYVPRFQQRGTFIQPIITNQIGGDRLNIQSLSFCVRVYGERVTK